MLLEVPEHLHIVFLEECGPWPGLTELSLLGPVIAAQHICHKTSDVCRLRLSNKILNLPFVPFTLESGVSGFRPQLTSLFTTAGFLKNPWSVSWP